MRCASEQAADDRAAEASVLFDCILPALPAALRQDPRIGQLIGALETVLADVTGREYTAATRRLLDAGLPVICAHLKEVAHA